MIALLTNIIASSLLLCPFEVNIDELHQVEISPENHTILFVRHGESALNVRDANGILYVSGKSPAIPLTENGQRQADELGKKLKTKLEKYKKYIILSSTAKRAQDTADRIFEQLKDDFAIERGECFDNLQERSQGIWEGKPRDSSYNEMIAKWEKLSAKDKFYTPQLSTGETNHEVALRAFSDLSKIMELHPNVTIILVSHYATLNAMALNWSHQIEQLSEEPETPLPKIVFNNCDILKVEVPQNGTIEDAKVTMHIKTRV